MSIAGLLQPTAITISSFLAGGILSLSFIGVPSLSLAPTNILLTQFANLYRLGRNSAPPLALVSALCSSYLSYTTDTSQKTRLWATAAALTIAIVPYTLLVMGSVNGGLHAREREVRSRGGEAKGLGEAWENETRRLMNVWKWTNAGRGLLPLMGCVAGWLALSS